MKKVAIYTTSTCTYCKMAKDFFKENGVDYQEYNVSTDLDKRKEMIDRTGQMGVPVIDIDGNLIVGFDRNRIAEAIK